MASDVASIDCSLPRRVNGQAIILRELPELESSEGVSQKRWHVLLQRRSALMQAMPGHLAAIGGCRSALDPDSRGTVLREVMEETGLLGGIVVPPCKFAEGEKCDWYVMTVRSPIFDASADTEHECGDVHAILPDLPPSSSVAECYGHAWVPVAEVNQIDPGRIPLMGGLVGRIRGAIRHLEILDKRKAFDCYLTNESVMSLLSASGIVVSIDGMVNVCPKEVGASKLGPLRTQLEYYLSDGNLRHDKFFHGKIASDADGWLDISLIMSCKKIQSMQATQDDIVAALEASEIEIRSDCIAIRRPHNTPLPVLEIGKGAKGHSKGYATGKGNCKGKSRDNRGGKGKSVGKIDGQFDGDVQIDRQEDCSEFGEISPQLDSVDENDGRRQTAMDAITTAAQSLQ